MTLPDLARLRELLGRATPAPWETLYPIDKHTEEMEWYLTPLDAQLAIELRNSAPALLDAAERYEDVASSLREVLRALALVPESMLTSLIVDPYGVIGDALEALGESREPDSWRALQRFADLGDPGPSKEAP